MKQRKVPIRMCIGCRQMKPKKELLRIVIPKEGGITLDPSGKLQGRGVYVCPDEKCLLAAQRNKAVRLNDETVRAIQDEIQKRLHEED